MDMSFDRRGTVAAGGWGVGANSVHLAGAWGEGRSGARKWVEVRPGSTVRGFLCEATATVGVLGR